MAGKAIIGKARAHDSFSEHEVQQDCRRAARGTAAAVCGGAHDARAAACGTTAAECGGSHGAHNARAAPPRQSAALPLLLRRDATAAHATRARPPAACGAAAAAAEGRNSGALAAAEHGGGAHDPRTAARGAAAAAAAAVEGHGGGAIATAGGGGGAYGTAAPPGSAVPQRRLNAGARLPPLRGVARAPPLSTHCSAAGQRSATGQRSAAAAAAGAMRKHSDAKSSEARARRKRQLRAQLPPALSPAAKQCATPLMVCAAALALGVEVDDTERQAATLRLLHVGAFMGLFDSMPPAENLEAPLGEAVSGNSAAAPRSSDRMARAAAAVIEDLRARISSALEAVEEGDGAGADATHVSAMELARTRGASRAASRAITAAAAAAQATRRSETERNGAAAARSNDTAAAAAAAAAERSGAATARGSDAAAAAAAAARRSGAAKLLLLLLLLPLIAVARLLSRSTGAAAGGSHDGAACSGGAAGGRGVAGATAVGGDEPGAKHDYGARMGDSPRRFGATSRAQSTIMGLEWASGAVLLRQRHHPSLTRQRLRAPGAEHSCGARMGERSSAVGAASPLSTDMAVVAGAELNYGGVAAAERHGAAAAAGRSGAATAADRPRRCAAAAAGAGARPLLTSVALAQRQNAAVRSLLPRTALPQQAEHDGGATTTGRSGGAAAAQQHGAATAAGRGGARAAAQLRAAAAGRAQQLELQVEGFFSEGAAPSPPRQGGFRGVCGAGSFSDTAATCAQTTELERWRRCNRPTWVRRVSRPRTGAPLISQQAPTWR
ncbi:hypothetical protein JKP88DRAFT_288476 [Tribonema minus]|uniref:Uncharacterized protein n=1 Tax=Tribonema minus TaxID=303371 RepID=A0A835Z6W5_9STRA|nr:hypothetical protein JKP88DRAFT_288476 [Tribonema minus]